MFRLFKDIVRIISVTENLLYLAGKSLQRRAMRNGVLITLAFSSSIIRTNYINAQELSPEQVTALVIGAFVSYPAGALMVRVANFLTRDNLQTAAAGYLHLTSHFKQSQRRLHLHYLWHEVFSQERHFSTPDDLAQQVYGKPEPEPLCQDQLGDPTLQCLFEETPLDTPELQNAYHNFVIRGNQALSSPQPMGVQSAAIGFHLGPMEDWYEKGFFAYEDYPAKAVVRDPLVRRCQRLTLSPLQWRFQNLLTPEAAPSFWYAFTVRKFGTQVGRALGRLNRMAEAQGFPDYFDSQHFTWPSEELDKTVKRDFHLTNRELPEELFYRRKRLMNALFGADSQTVKRHIMRMFARDYSNILKIRIRLDAAWTAGRLISSPWVEIDGVEQQFSVALVRPDWIELQTENARTHLMQLDRFLGHSEEWDQRNPAYQVMQLACHLDYNGFRSKIVVPGARERLEFLKNHPEQTRADYGFLLEMMHRIRIYHVLTKLQIHAYWSIVSQIGEVSTSKSQNS